MPPEGSFYCLRCARTHRRSSTIGGYHHAGLDGEKENFSAGDLAVGISLVFASRDRRRPEATADEVEAEFRERGFDEQFSSFDVESRLRTWVDIGVISDGRHSGKKWYLFLANRRTPRRADRSPESFHLWMKKYADAYERARKR